MATQSSNNDSRLDDKALQHVTIINDEGLSFGLPTIIFWGGVVFSVLFFFVLHWTVGVVFGVVYFTAMFAIHKDDPKALQAWVDAALNRRQDAWCAGTHKSRKVYYIHNKE